jgi:mRNA interferase MazF
MVSPGFVPKRGDLVWVDMNPRVGHEQAGRRPAVVISPELYNRKAGLALVCPITSKKKGYPFETSIPAGLPIQGVILSDQVKNVDWNARKMDPAGQLDSATLLEVISKLRTLIDG